MDTIVESYAGAARAVRDLVAQIPPAAYDGPGLGAWSLRDLVGHTSRALVTVVEYLGRDEVEVSVGSAAEYVAAIGTAAVDPEAVSARARRAGLDLGDDPAAYVARLVDDAVRVVRETDVAKVVPTIAGGMTVAAYLPTRTFELCVHGLDVAEVTGLGLELPAEAVEEAVTLAALAAARTGKGPDLLLAATGRRGLPAGFSVV